MHFFGNRKHEAWLKRFENSHRDPRTYTEGDLVLVEYRTAASGESRKFEPKYRGPDVIGFWFSWMRRISRPKHQKHSTEPEFSSDKIKQCCCFGPDEDIDKGNGQTVS